MAERAEAETTALVRAAARLNEAVGHLEAAAAAGTHARQARDAQLAQRLDALIERLQQVLR